MISASTKYHKGSQLTLFFTTSEMERWISAPVNENITSQGAFDKVNHRICMIMNTFLAELREPLFPKQTLFS
jgi:hypothetical protein